MPSCCTTCSTVPGERFAVDASLIRADANKQNTTHIDEWPVERLDRNSAPRAVREYLDTLDDAAFGATTDVKPKFTSQADPASKWIGARKGPAFFADADNYLIDTYHAVIVDVETTRTIRRAETGAARTVIDRTLSRFGLYPESLVADRAYGSADMLGWLVYEHGIEPHIPVFDKSKRSDGCFEKADSTYDHKTDAYTCPAGRQLRSRHKVYRKPRPLVDEDGMMRNRASKLDCDVCAFKQLCCPKADGVPLCSMRPF